MRFILVIVSFVSAFILALACATREPGKKVTSMEDVKNKIKNQFNVHTSYEHRAKEKAEKEEKLRLWTQKRAVEQVNKEAEFKPSQPES